MESVLEEIAAMGMAEYPEELEEARRAARSNSAAEQKAGGLPQVPTRSSGQVAATTGPSLGVPRAVPSTIEQPNKGEVGTSGLSGPVAVSSGPAAAGGVVVGPSNRSRPPSRRTSTAGGAAPVSGQSQLPAQGSAGDGAAAQQVATDTSVDAANVVDLGSILAKQQQQPAPSSAGPASISGTVSLWSTVFGADRWAGWNIAASFRFDIYCTCLWCYGGLLCLSVKMHCVFHT